MSETLEDGTDWSALHRFRSLNSDAERMEQLFMTSLSASRSSRQNGEEISKLGEKVALQNGRVGKLENRVIQIFAVLAFLGVAVPAALSLAALLK